MEIPNKSFHLMFKSIWHVVFKAFAGVRAKILKVGVIAMEDNARPSRNIYFNACGARITISVTREGWFYRASGSYSE
ncbi:hypothetical protein LZ023_16580 [Pseudomonas silvicola]|nr:hypothetical protein LZ023_16580 [Pseudomonas silvicola]